MTSAGGVKYGRVTWWPVSGPRGLLRWQTGRSDSGSGADAALTWHDMGMVWAGGKPKW